MLFMVISNEDDRQKVAVLYEKYKFLLFKVANEILRDRYLAEDAIHQTFITVIKNLHKIDEKNCPQTKVFLVIIIRNIAINIYNRRSYLNLRNDSMEEICDLENTEADNLDEIVISGDNVRRIIKAIKELKPIYRDVLLLNKVYGYSVEEIVEMLGVNKETVKKRISRARNFLLKALKEVTEDEK